MAGRERRARRAVSKGSPAKERRGLRGIKAPGNPALQMWFEPKLVIMPLAAFRLCPRSARPREDTSSKRKSAPPIRPPTLDAGRAEQGASQLRIRDRLAYRLNQTNQCY
jgi:hypothetical protein